MTLIATKKLEKVCKDLSKIEAEKGRKKEKEEEKMRWEEIEAQMKENKKLMEDVIDTRNNVLSNINRRHEELRKVMNESQQRCEEFKRQIDESQARTRENIERLQHTIDSI